MEDRPLVIGKGQSWHIRKGVWQIRHSLGKDPVTGKYRYSPKRTIHAKNKSEVLAALEDYKRELNAGIVVRREPATVGEYARQFHELREGTMKSPLAYKREALEVRHIDELLGPCRLQDLRPPMIRQAYARARKVGRFSENELNKVNMKLRQILQEAVDDEILVKNPCAGISVPRPAPKERRSLTVEEASRLLGCLLAEKADPHIIATLLMLDTGMRRGEALGLTWEHVDLERGSVEIAQQFGTDKTPRAPKSKMSRRTIALSHDVADVLASWRERQARELRRLALGQTGTTPVAHALRDKGTHKAISSKDPDGAIVEVTYMDPNNYSRWFRGFCSDNGFGHFETVTDTFERDGRTCERGKGYVGLTPHMLRHTQATLLIGSNTDVKTVQARLGHSSVTLTLNTYSHAIAANDKKAAETFGNLLADASASDKDT